MKQLFTHDIHFNIFYILLLAAMATLPFTNWLMLPIAVLMLLNWITEWNWREKWQILKTRKAIPAIIIFSAFFYLALYGLFLSFNKSKAASCFDCYLWFAVAPLVLLTSKPDQLNKQRIRCSFALFTFFTTLCVIALLVIAIYHVAITGNRFYLYYVKFSVFKHPSYMAMYVTMSISFIFYFLWKKWKKMILWQILLLLCALTLLFVGAVLLQSKAGLLVLGVTLVLWFLFFIFHQKHKIGWTILFAMICFATVWVVFKSDVIRYNRIKDLVGVAQNHRDNPYGYESSQIRLTLWKTAWEVSQKNLPWGVGTGDVWDEMQVHAVYHNYHNIIGRKYNAHNQYLQTLMMAGIPGIVVLLAFCGYPLIRSIRKRDILYLLFSILLILNIIVECMFEQRAGVDFFALMNALLFLRDNQLLYSK